MCGSRLEWKDKRGGCRRGQGQKREREGRRERVCPSAITEIEIPQPRESSHRRIWLFMAPGARASKIKAKQILCLGRAACPLMEKGCLNGVYLWQERSFHRSLELLLLLLFWLCVFVSIWQLHNRRQPSTLTKWFFLILWTKVLCGLMVAKLRGQREICSRENFKTSNKKWGNHRPTNSSAGPGHIPINVARASGERWGATCQPFSGLTGTSLISAGG